VSQIDDKIGQRYDAVLDLELLVVIVFGSLHPQVELLLLLACLLFALSLLKLGSSARILLGLDLRLRFLFFESLFLCLVLELFLAFGLVLLIE
jgi:hypothetical protein